MAYHLFHSDFAFFCLQMIFLYKDPKGKSLSVTHSQTGSIKVAIASKAPSQSNKSVTDLEKKVASLERAMQDGEKTIAELRQRISVLTKEKESMEVQKNRCNYFINVFTVIVLLCRKRIMMSCQRKWRTIPLWCSTLMDDW